MSEAHEFPSLPLSQLVTPEELPQGGNMTNRIHALLRKLIVEVKLLPGRALSEKEIAALLNVSKTPVREAIIRLSEEGFVTVVPQGGTYISPIDVQRYMEACFIRFKLEEGAVIEAAKRHSLEDIARLKTCLSNQRIAAKDEEFTNFFLLDEEFHKNIFAAARLPGAWSVVNQAKGEMDRMRHLKRVFAVRRTEKVIEEHEAIVDGIESGDVEAAREAVQRHLGSLETKIAELSRNPKIWTFIEQVNTRVTRKRASRGSRTPA
ncbi:MULTISPECIES: GntR family transcriptional regulator [Agrobacterium]|uniref:GntR family transcriptional regulator n=1 Tax=Agrobacterium TaxID=357 RepID=UPI0023008ECA|nr:MULTISPECIES: GntR family transcriptional regulator [Agrobacterium]MDA5639300.1 GntR family transcriptional regulator [Agrobacterium sp. ST15.13.013]MDA6999225.1 GntR family transcriptional regulator [Agrobacterium salinitolerans]